VYLRVRSWATKRNRKREIARNAWAEEGRKDKRKRARPVRRNAELIRSELFKVNAVKKSWRKMRRDQNQKNRGEGVETQVHLWVRGGEEKSVSHSPQGVNRKYVQLSHVFCRAWPVQRGPQKTKVTGKKAGCQEKKKRGD